MGKKKLKKKQRQDISELSKNLLKEIEYFKQELDILDETLHFTGKRLVTEEYKKILDYIEERPSELYASLVIKIISTIEQNFKEAHKVIFYEEYGSNYSIIMSVIGKIDRHLDTEMDYKSELGNYINDRNKLVHEAFSINVINQINNFSDATSYIKGLINFIECSICSYYQSIKKSKK